MLKKIGYVLTIITLTLSLLNICFATTDVVNLKIGNVSAKVNTGSTEYDVERGEKITISTTDTTVTKIAYQVGEKAERSSVTVNGRTATFTLPSDLKNGSFSLQVSVYHSSSGWGTIQTYCLNMVNPEFILKMDGNEVKENTTTTLYEVVAGKKLDIEAIPSTSISHIGYKFEKLDYVQVSGYETQITIPQNGEVNSNGFELQVSAYDQTTGSWLAKKSYFFKIFKPVIYVTYNGNKLNNDAISTAQEVKAGDKILVTSNLMSIIDTIKYKFEGQTEKTVSCRGTGATLTIPTGYAGDKTFSLNISGRGINGVWMVDRTVYFKMKKVEEPIIQPITPEIVAKIENINLVSGKTYKIKPKQTISITATPEKNISKIYYCFSLNGISFKDSYIEVNDSSIILDIPVTNTAISNIGLKVKALSTTNTISKVYMYNLKLDNQVTDNPVTDNPVTDNPVIDNPVIDNPVIDNPVIDNPITDDPITDDPEDEDPEFENPGTESKYEIIVNSDEKLNDEIEGLNVSIRNVNNKSGNKNISLLNEEATYYIDYANGEQNIEGEVNIVFKVTENIGVDFTELDGGTNDGKTVLWVLNGLNKNENGTITLKLKYNSLTSNYKIINPTVTIESEEDTDESSLQELVVKDSSTEVETNHKPYMFGDDGTNTFRPDDKINRAEAAAVLVRVFNIPLVKNYTVKYKDAMTISEGRFVWAEQSIMTVTEYGLMEGYDDGTFKPGNYITKAEFATILARKFEVDNASLKVKNNPIKLFDNSDLLSSNHWSTKYVTQLMRLNRLSTVIDTSDNVNDKITRGEVANLVNICLYRGPSSDEGNVSNRFTDVDKNTSNYEHIIEATADTHNSKFTSQGKEIMVK